MSRNKVNNIEEHYEVYDPLDDYISEVCKKQRCKIITCIDCGCCDLHCRCNDVEYYDIEWNN